MWQMVFAYVLVKGWIIDPKLALTSANNISGITTL